MNIRLILGALPLLIYPFIAIASFMSLAAQPTGRESALVMIAARAFQVTSLIYPLVYGVAALAAFSEKKTNPAKATRLAAIPLWFLGIILLLFIAWSAVGTP